MPLPDSVILVCAGTDAARAAESGHPLLDLCLSVDVAGHLRTAAPDRPCAYLGLQDPGPHVTQINAARAAEDLLRECRRTGARGVFADLESDTAAVRNLCAVLDDALHDAGLTLFVPPSRVDDVLHAVITLETAMSGGSLSERIAQAQSYYGRARVAALLLPVSADFCLPSQTSDGTPLSDEKRLALLRQYRSQIFFSRELCAKYFTYMDEGRRGHFVLFDDESTWLAKLSLLDRLHVGHRFALYPDAAPLLQSRPQPSAVRP